MANDTVFQTGVLSQSAPWKGELPELLIVAPSAHHVATWQKEMKARGMSKLQARGLLADAIPCFANERVALLGPVLGTSALYASLTQLLRPSTPVLFIGFAGSIDIHLQIGSIALPLHVCKPCDLSDELPIIFSLMNTTVFPKPSTVHLVRGITVENPYATTKDDIDRWRSNSISIIEMELFALAKLQRSIGFQLFAAAVVSDYFDQDGRHTSKISSSTVRQQNRALCRAVLTAFL